MSNTTTTSGDFVMEFFNQAAYSPDDKKAKYTLENGLHADFTVTINETPFSRAQFIEMILGARVKELYELVESRELLASAPNEDGGVSAVAHIQTFRAISKSGEKEPYNITSVTLCLVQQIEGQKKLMRLTEVTKSFQN